MNVRKKITTAIVSLACLSSFGQNAQFDYFEYQGKDSRFEQTIDWGSQYFNPIVSGFYPDPSICRKDDTYYLVHSSFSYYPGIPIFTSKDLVHWTQIGHVLDRPSQLSINDGHPMSGGIFAPAIEYNKYNDTFYMITTNVGLGNFFVKSKDPAKGWSDPILLPEVRGIDPSFYFDSKGKGYIVHNDAPEGTPDWEQQRTVRIHEFDVANDCTVGKNKEIVRGGSKIEKKPIWIEAPHLYKINKMYYLMCAEGGTDTYHSEVVFRSKNPWGPWEEYAGNPILTQRDLPNDRPNKVTCAGHADLIETPEGEWWAVFLASRPYEGDFINTGRETFMLPVTWKDDFPVILPQGEAMPIVVNKKNMSSEPSKTSGNFVYRNDFDSTQLDFSWVSLRRPGEAFYTLGDGKLNLKAQAVSIAETKSPSVMFYRQQHTSFEAVTKLSFAPKTENDFAGITLFQNEKYNFTFGKTVKNNIEYLVVNRTEGTTSSIASVEIAANEKAMPIYLKVAGKGRYYDFLYSFDGKDWKVIVAGADGINLSTRKAQGFLGACIGLYASSASQNTESKK